MGLQKSPLLVRHLSIRQTVLSQIEMSLNMIIYSPDIFLRLTTLEVDVFNLSLTWLQTENLTTFLIT